ncbi:MAG TPA: UDP-N-acetylmuramoyl-L-alanyl-D-glutamate--2,6-diaminopimelate ligase [Nitrospirota bacterium]|nr:UDP-N-acetylmuramoyl-L-alanyl-D-glutamate--2,6-diaminopimelate ligase [Nitrospirota bacterium]
MKLGELIAGLDAGAALPDAWRDIEVSGVVHDSRKVIPGSLFVAVRGFHSDGHRFIEQAVRQGACAVVAEEGARTAGVAVLLVPDTRKALARLAASFYGHPSRQLGLVGITGTKGKTTTSYLVKSILEAAGHVTGLIGTIDYRVGNRIYPAPNTTPEATDVQMLLREMVNTGAAYCVMEVSSHALALGRTDGCLFQTAVFTNLQQDHLDFHKDRESYLQAKLLLFKGLGQDKTAVVNNDDPAAGEVIAETQARLLTFGLTEGAAIRPVEGIRQGMHGLKFTARTPQGSLTVESQLVGMHNAYNILAAIGAARSLGIDDDSIIRGIRDMRAVPGRMEKVDEGQPFGVIVDYAHTEESLISLLAAVRGVAEKRIITVFGCGGDRDRTKRPKMGAAAAAGSDVVIITTDNPRTEDPLAIISEVETGMAAAGTRIAPGEAAHRGAAGRTPYLVIVNRAEAIAAAVEMAEPGDVVVLAGKGHENYQIIGDRKIHFDDREAAREAIRRRR